MQKRPQDEADVADKSESSQLAEPEKTDKTYAFMDLVEIKAESKKRRKLGRVVYELYNNITPRTCENFLQICKGNKMGLAGKPLCYKGSKIHKVVPRFCVQGGDITNFDGSGGESIYGPTFEDESFDLELQAGVIGMASSGNTNSSQFFIACDAFPHLQSVHVGFGRVVKGFKIFQEISEFDHVDNCPVNKIVIDDCGELPANSAQWNYWESDGQDVYPPYPEDWEPKEEVTSKNWAREVVEAIKIIKDCGNQYISNYDYDTASQKYLKALRYLDWVKSVNKDVHKSDCSTLSVACLLNLAQTNLQFGNYREACQQCTEAIEINPNEAKAYFRRGLANFGLHNYETATENLDKALKLEPGDKKILKAILEIEKAKEKARKEERHRFANVLK